MKVIIQRCLKSCVMVDNKIVGQIKKGFTIFFGAGKNDTEKDLDYIVKKVCGLRVFEDENQKMNLSPNQVQAEALIISNFTLYANTSRGFRPDFFDAMMPQRAEEFFNKFIQKIKEQNVFKNVEHGIFGADMKVSVENDGPINIIIDSKEIK